MEFLAIMVIVAVLFGGAFTYNNVHLRDKHGVITGTVKDVSVEGLIIKSCEIGVQVGSASNDLDFSSTTDQGLCDKAKALMNKNVVLKYRLPTTTFHINTNDEVVSIEPAE